MENTQITLEEYLNEVEEQNKILLDEMSKYEKNSQIYKLKWMQYQTNILNIKMNMKFGFAFIGQNL